MAQVALDVNVKNRQNMKCPRCVSNGSLTMESYIEWNEMLCNSMVPKHISREQLTQLELHEKSHNYDCSEMDIVPQIKYRCGYKSKKSKKRKRNFTSCIQISLNDALIKLEKRDSRLRLTTLEHWNNEIKGSIGDTIVNTEDGNEINGPPEITIKKTRGNTKAPGVFHMWFDGTMAFVFEEPSPAITLENTEFSNNTKFVMYARPGKNYDIISVNVFVNAYSIFAGCTGQKNGKEWLFGSTWRNPDNKYYKTFLRIIDEDSWDCESDESCEENSYNN
jgi:hypothetical protein